jgi:AcrR family transcriptional regulator
MVKEAVVRDEPARQVADEDGSTPAERRRRARRGEGDRLRAEIVEAASELLAATGELSLRAVAREVGVAATSIYLHFRNLDELVLAVKTRYFAEFGKALDEAARLAGDEPLVRVRARALAYVRYGTEHPGRYHAMFTSEMLPPGMRSTAHFAGVEVFEAAADEVAAAMGPGEDAGMLAVHLWTALHGIVALRAARPNFPWPDLTREIDSLTGRLLGIG